MQVTALTDAAGNSLIEDVPMTGLTTSRNSRRQKTSDVWSRELNERKCETLSKLMDDPYFSLLASHLLFLGASPEEMVECGRVVCGKLRMIRYGGKEYREFRRNFYVRLQP